MCACLPPQRAAACLLHHSACLTAAAAGTVCQPLLAVCPVQLFLHAVGYFSPIGGTAHPETGSHPLDKHLRLVHDTFELRSDVKSMFGVAEDEAVRLVASGKRAELIDRIYASYMAYKDSHDVVLVQGTSLGSGKLDAEIAGALNAPAIIACQVKVGGRVGE